MTADLIVVGAGPAGSMAAYHAATSGLDVLVLTRPQTARAKPCAGGISTKALARLPFSITGILENTTRQIRIGLRQGRAKEFSTGGIVCGFVQRRDFDHLLLERAVQAGARVRQISAIEGLEITAGNVHLKISDGTILQSKYLIAADGANSQMRKLVSPDMQFSRGFALEGTVPYRELVSRPKMEFSFGCAEHGYGWLFPKKDHVNVGIYSCHSEVRLSKTMLRQYAKSKLGTDAIDGILGFPLGFGGMTYRQTQEQILFAGDAAGMVEPLLGEGIYNAIKSGELAGLAVARAIQSGRPIDQSYNLALQDIRKDLARSETMAKLFYQYLDWGGYRALTFHVTMRRLMQGFAAGNTMHEITNLFLMKGWQNPVFTEGLEKNSLIEGAPDAD